MQAFLGSGPAGCLLLSLAAHSLQRSLQYARNPLPQTHSPPPLIRPPPLLPPLPPVVKDEAHLAEEENQELWTADWDDEATGEDFQQKLRRELGRHMKD